MSEPQMLQVHLTSDVFVAGAAPRATYVSRDGGDIDQQIDRYLADRGKALIVHGATKSGKTTLVESALSAHEAIWVQGQDVSSMRDFWRKIAMSLNVATELQYHDEHGNETKTEDSIQAGIPNAAALRETNTSSQSIRKGRTTGANPPIDELARHALEADPRPIVLDDFHFIPEAVRLTLTRAIKTLIRTSHVILIAVPYASFEPVRREPEMAGRIWTLEIPPWSEGELSAIASTGFNALNLFDPGEGVAKSLAKNSFGSPFIMQQLCHDLVRWEHEVEETVPATRHIVLPADVDRFYRNCADRTRPDLFDEFFSGPRTKGTARQKIELISVGSTDIYGAVLSAIRDLLPKLDLPEREIHTRLSGLVKNGVAAGRTNNALRQLGQIAEKNRRSSDPVAVFRQQVFHISDPFLAFFLAHGSWSPLK